jgi:hypothetical protein
MLSPDDAAIFSPAKEAAAKKIVRISPADIPITNSVNAITNPRNDPINSILGNTGFNVTTIIVKLTLIRILTGKRTNLAPNKGDVNKNEPIRKVANKN